MRQSEQLSRFSAQEAAVAAAVEGMPGRSARLMRLWFAIVVAVTLLNLALAIWYVIRTGDDSLFYSHQLFLPFLAIIYTFLGRMTLTHRPRNVISWIFFTVGALFLLISLAASIFDRMIPPTLNSPGLIDLATWLGNWTWLPAQILPVTFVFLLFPDGHLPSPRWRPVGWATGLGLLLLTLGLAAHPGGPSDWGIAHNPYGIVGAESELSVVLNVGSIFLLIGALGSMFAVIWRFRRSRGIERAQIKWLVYAAVFILAVGVLAVPLWRSGNLNDTLSRELSIVLTNVVTLGIAAAATVAIVRYRLYDIDFIINRTLVYGVMTGVILLIYGLTVGGAGILLESQGNWFLTLVATGLVAVLFQPIRNRLQRGVNRLLYGQRDEPFEVLAHLGQRLEQTLTPDAVYPTIVETVAQALRLPYVALQVRQDEGFETAESYGRPVAEPAILPLTNQGEIVGRLLVARRTGDEEFSGADQQLLQNIARQAGAAVHGAKLTADLQRSRQQLVTSREEERRRLRRDLHDGLGPSLASLLLEARVLRRMIRDDPAAAERLADEMQADIRTTIEDIRRVVHELRPPALDDLGLVPALNVLAGKIGQPDRAALDATRLQVQVDAPDNLPPLPAAVEVAAYRIIQEALTNVVHHANARCAAVRLWLDHQLHIEVADDGVGFKESRAGGLGLRSMRERAAELGGSCTVAKLEGGGTLVRAVLPVGEA